MKTSKKGSIPTAVAIFVGLAIVYAVLAITAWSFSTAYVQTLLVGLGSAIFGSGLTFFLITITQSASSQD